MNNYGDDLGVLSDGSNDSFFDDPKPRKPSLTTKTQPNKNISDLFNITDSSQVPRESENAINNNKTKDDWLGLNVSKSASPAKISKKISFDQDDNILDSIGLSKKTTKPSTESVGKKTDLLESILGISSSKNEAKTISNTTNSSDLLIDNKAKTPPRTPQTSDLPREGRRGRRSSGGLLMDPLGLLTKSSSDLSTREIDNPAKSLETPIKNKSESIVISSKPSLSKSTPNISSSDLPEWLGGSAVKQNKSELAVSHHHQSSETQQTQQDQSSIIPKDVVLETHNNNNNMNPFNQQKFAQSQIEYQNAAYALQQQETNLMIALNLKKYEENLLEIQQKQNDMLKRQEEQFKQLLETQFTKQQIMENNMRIQQERINSHMNLLISQVPFRISHSDAAEADNSKPAVTDSESMMNNLREKFSDELKFIEESYRKQIALLQETLESTEKRLKEATEKITESYEEKIKLINIQHEKEIESFKSKIDEIHSNHYEDIKNIRVCNDRVIEEIKHEHEILIENIKEGKKLESSFFGDSQTILQKLDSNVELLYSSSRTIQDLKQNVEEGYGVLTVAREESLKAKEREISLMRESLEKCRQSAEQERGQLLGLIRSLETKISEQNQKTREDSWAFQQATSTLAARSLALDREAEFNRNSIERERQQLKTLRESILAEREKIYLELTEEKLQLSAEKSRLETSLKLNANCDPQRAKSEIEAAIQVAKEAAEMTDRERENLMREKCEVEKLKRSLLDKEKKLNSREIELENLLREAETKVSEGERAVSESRAREMMYNERLKELQRQLIILSSKEKKVAEEKIALAKERLAINTITRQIKKCGLCNADSQQLNQVDMFHYSSNYENVDADVVHLRMEALEDRHEISEIT